MHSSIMSMGIAGEPEQVHAKNDLAWCNESKDEFIKAHGGPPTPAHDIVPDMKFGFVCSLPSLPSTSTAAGPENPGQTNGQQRQ